MHQGTRHTGPGRQRFGALDQFDQMRRALVRGRHAASANPAHFGTCFGPSVGYFLQLLAGAGWTSLPALPLIRQQAFVLAGNDDPLIPLVNARIMRTLLPHATLRVFEDSHLGLLTSADELGPLVSRFLTSRPGDGTSSPG